MSDDAVRYSDSDGRDGERVSIAVWGMLTGNALATLEEIQPMRPTHPELTHFVNRLMRCMDTRIDIELAPAEVRRRLDDHKTYVVIHGDHVARFRPHTIADPVRAIGAAAQQRKSRWRGPRASDETSHALAARDPDGRLRRGGLEPVREGLGDSFFRRRLMVASLGNAGPRCKSPKHSLWIGHRARVVHACCAGAGSTGSRRIAEGLRQQIGAARDRRLRASSQRFQRPDVGVESGGALRMASFKTRARLIRGRTGVGSGNEAGLKEMATRTSAE